MSNPNMSEAEYRKALGLSQSSLKKFLISPAHYLSSLEEQKEPTKEMQIGTAFHAVLLQQKPSDFYAVSKKFDRRKTQDKIEAEQFELENAGKAIIDSEDEQTILKMKESILAHPTAKRLINNLTHKEFPLFADVQAEQGTVRIKGLLDGYIESEGIVVDAKSCVDASPKGFKKAIWDFGYMYQNIHYKRLLELNGKKFTKFYFVCVEKKPPYAVGVYFISSESLSLTESVWNNALNFFSICQREGNYPAYSQNAVEIQL